MQKRNAKAHGRDGRNGANPNTSPQDRKTPQKRSWHRRDRSAKLERTAEYLLQRFVTKASWTDDVRHELATILQVTPDTVDVYLSSLAKQQIASRTYLVNHFATRFRHEFRVTLSIDLPKLPRNQTLSVFLTRLIHDINHDHQLPDQHILITEAIVLFGAPEGHDVELTVLSDSGITAMEPYILDRLGRTPCIRDSTTRSVSWRFSLNGSI